MISDIQMKAKLLGERLVAAATFRMNNISASQKNLQMLSGFASIDVV